MSEFFGKTASSRVARRWQARRVARRWVEAIEFPTDEALKKYLDEHPHADPKNHSVSEGGEGKGKEEEGGESTPPPSPSFWSLKLPPLKLPTKSTVKGYLKALKDTAKVKADQLARVGTFLKESPKSIQSFVLDPQHREKTLKAGAEKLRSSKKTFIKDAVSTLEKQGTSYKKSWGAVKKLASAPPYPTLSELEGLTRTVLRLTTTAAVLSTGGLGAGALYLGQSHGMAFLRGLTAKAVTRATGSLINAEYLTKRLQQSKLGRKLVEHGHGMAELVSSDKELSDEEQTQVWELILDPYIDALADGFEKGLSTEEVAEALVEDPKED